MKTTIIPEVIRLYKISRATGAKPKRALNQAYNWYGRINDTNIIQLIID